MMNKKRQINGNKTTSTTAKEVLLSKKSRPFLKSLGVFFSEGKSSKVLESLLLLN